MSLSDCFDELESSEDVSRPTQKSKTPSITGNTTEMRLDRTQYADTIDNESPEERQALFDELQREYNEMLCKEKPAVIFAQNERDVKEGTTLEHFLVKHGPFPVEEHIAVKIIRSVSDTIMFLHSKDVVHGCLDFSSVVLDRHLNAKTIISASIHRTKSSRAACRGKVDDVFHVGLLLYRLLTGLKAKFNGNGDLVSAPSKYMRISEKGMKLVEYMFATNLRFPPTIGRVRYNDWIEECDENPPVFIMFPH